MEDNLIEKKILQEISNLAANACETIKRLLQTKAEIEKTKQPLENKDWRIEKMRENESGGGYIYEVNLDGSVNPWSNKMESVEEALKFGYTIHTVRRLSDNSVWGVNEDTQMGEIDSFMISGNNMYVKIRKISPTRNICFDLSQLQKPQAKINYWETSSIGCLSLNDIMNCSQSEKNGLCVHMDKLKELVKKRI